MKNVLFVGPYYQNCGWGNAARGYLRALIMSGHNVTAIPVYLNNQKEFEEYPEFKKSEETRYDNYDVVIQHCLPHMFRKYGGVKNIGVSHFETTIRYCPWVSSLNLMDEVWVCSDFETNQLIKSGVKSTIRKVPIPCDLSKYYGLYDFPLKEHEHEYKFLFVGEYITRKNVKALVTAFHREFGVSEPVRLIIKTNLSGVDSYNLLKRVSTDINQIKTDMKLYPSVSDYKDDLVITDFLDENSLYGLYNECNCFVMPSSGEAFSIPSFDALGFGCDRIVNMNSGMAEISYSKCNYLVDSRETPAIAVDRPLPYLYNGRDTWWEIDILDLQRQMRKCYEKKESRAEKKEANMRDLEAFSYANIGNLMRDLL